MQVVGAQADARSGSGRSTPARRPADLSRFAIPVAVVTLALVLTAPIWLIYVMIAGLVAVWSLDGPVGVLLGLAAMAMPLVASVLLAVANARCARDADRAAGTARSLTASSEARRRRVWSTAGVIAGAGGAVAYGLLLVVSTTG